MLIKNELLKLFKRKSTVVMLALIVLSSFLLMTIYGGSVSYPDIYYMDDGSWWVSEAEWLEEEYGKKNPDGSYVDQSEYAYESRNRAAMYRYLISFEEKGTKMQGTRDWRYPLVEEMCAYRLALEVKGELSAADQARHDELMRIVESGDWRIYYTSERDRIIAQNEGASKIRLEAFTFEYDYKLEHNVEPSREPWRDTLISRAATAKKSLVPYLEAEARGETVDPADTEEYRNNLALAMYRLENNIEHDVSAAMNGNNGGAETFWEYFANSTTLTTFVGIMMIVIAGRIVAEEYSGGTIKFLLICPAKREKILFSKYFTVLLMGLLMMSTLYVSSGVFALIFSGGEEIGASVLTAKNGVVREMSPFIKMIGNYALQSVGMTVMATMAFAISTLMKSTALSVGVGLFCFTSGLAGAVLLAEENVDFGRYLIFSNVDLAAIARGESIFDYQTLPVALIVIAVHMVIFLLTACDAFTRRDV